MSQQKYKGTIRQRKNKAQKQYKLSSKGRITQARYYRSDAKKIASKRWREKPENKIKHAAHSMFFIARKVAKQARQPCEKCGKQNAYAHHNDYSKPLNVHWLCGFHHRQTHIHKSIKKVT